MNSNAFLNERLAPGDQSFSDQCHKIIYQTQSGLERLTGINQKQLQHYSSGLKKPRPAQVKKIKQALHALGNELAAVDL